MARVWVRSVVEQSDPVLALRHVTDFARWPDASDAVRSVTVETQPDGSEISEWEVTFRQGLMRWSERDWLDPERLEAAFDLIEGDPLMFRGTWRARPDGTACELTFDAEFDLGMPSLGHVLDPIAVEAVEDAIAGVLRGLYGEEMRVALTAEAPRDLDLTNDQGVQQGA
jgi:ribosome-associated toxin RatA of RatAB toxin-antitoxin module